LCYVVLFFHCAVSLIGILLLTRHINNKELNWIELNWIIIIMDLQPFVGSWPIFSLLIIYAFDRTHWTGDQPFARPLPIYRTTQTQNKLHTQTFIPWVGFEATIPTFERANMSVNYCRQISAGECSPKYNSVDSRRSSQEQRLLESAVYDDWSIMIVTNISQFWFLPQERLICMFLIVTNRRTIYDIRQILNKETEVRKEFILLFHIWNIEKCLCFLLKTF
jgi:hypothetical protein